VGTILVCSGLIVFGVWALLVAGANLNAYPSESQEANDYGEKHKSS
jgi:hypothetical protein